MDEVSGRLNTEERGQFIGAFDTGAQILNINQDGSYELNDLDINKKYDVNSLLHIGIHNEDQVISALHYDGEKGWTMVKRFQIETKSLGQKYSFINESSGSKLYFASVHKNPKVEIKYKDGKTLETKELALADLIDVKGWKAMGNKVGEFKVTKVQEIAQPKEEEIVEEQVENKVQKDSQQVDLFSSPPTKDKPLESPNEVEGEKFSPGDEIDLDL
jgi:topoisomerase-4 subunit A